jgi:hypothetical protein
VRDRDIFGALGRRLPAVCGRDWDAKAVEIPNGRRFIVWRDIPNKGRLVWNLIHECGHMTLGHIGARLDMRTGAMTSAPFGEEEAAHTFARHVLLPSWEVHEFLRRGWDPSRIATEKGVSRDAVKTRLAIMQESGDTGQWAI